uniref:ORF8 n=1 Tax=Panagrellus redivivus TaxID=6233 RepID=A0A7E4W6H4_PANRE
MMFLRVAIGFYLSIIALVVTLHPAIAVLCEEKCPGVLVCCYNPHISKNECVHKNCHKQWCKDCFKNGTMIDLSMFSNVNKTDFQYLLDFFKVDKTMWVLISARLIPRLYKILRRYSAMHITVIIGLSTGIQDSG